MSTHAEEAIGQYKQAYQRLYNRTPQYLTVVDENWVIVNGARMRASELLYMVQCLNEEYNDLNSKRQSIAQRLIAWFVG